MKWNPKPPKNPYDPDFDPSCDPEEDYWDWLEAEEGRREERRIKDEFENQ